MFKLGGLEPPMFIPEVDLMLRTPRLPLALRLRALLGVVSTSEKSKVAGDLAGAGAVGAGLLGLPNKHIYGLLLIIKIVFG